MTRILIGSALLFAIAAVTIGTWQDSTSRQEDAPATQRPQDPDSVSRRDFMRTKLMYTQNIFEGLTTGNFESIEEAITNVQMVTEGAMWVAIENEEYNRLTSEFKTATRRLMNAAKTRNIESTALRFYELSTSCIDCHQHIREARYDL